MLNFSSSIFRFSRKKHKKQKKNMLKKKKYHFLNFFFHGCCCCFLTAQIAFCKHFSFARGFLLALNFLFLLLLLHLPSYFSFQRRWKEQKKKQSYIIFYNSYSVLCFFLFFCWLRVLSLK